jgi:hypothetical protein
MENPIDKGFQGFYLNKNCICLAKNSGFSLFVGKKQKMASISARQQLLFPPPFKRFKISHTTTLNRLVSQ